jgi:hypothetical protein
MPKAVPEPCALHQTLTMRQNVELCNFLRSGGLWPKESVTRGEFVAAVAEVLSPGRGGAVHEVYASVRAYDHVIPELVLAPQIASALFDLLRFRLSPVSDAAYIHLSWVDPTQFDAGFIACMCSTPLPPLDVL